MGAAKMTLESNAKLLIPSWENALLVKRGDYIGTFQDQKFYKQDADGAGRTGKILPQIERI